MDYLFDILIMLTVAGLWVCLILGLNEAFGRYEDWQRRIDKVKEARLHQLDVENYIDHLELQRWLRGDAGLYDVWYAHCKRGKFHRA